LRNIFIDRNLIEKYWVAKLSITCRYTGFEDVPNSGPIYLLEKIGSDNAVAFFIVVISTYATEADLAVWHQLLTVPVEKNQVEYHVW
jgi:hypothetical protein